MTRYTEGYSKINDALWAAFARGEIDQDFLVVERFAALPRLYGAPVSRIPPGSSGGTTWNSTGPGSFFCCLGGGLRRALNGMGL